MFDYVIGQIKNLESRFGAEKKYAEMLEIEIESLKEKLKTLETQLLALKQVKTVDSKTRKKKEV